MDYLDKIYFILHMAFFYPSFMIFSIIDGQIKPWNDKSFHIVYIIGVASKE